MTIRTPASGDDASPIRRTWWTCQVIKSEYGSFEERTRVERQEDALLVASLTESGHHAPALDFDFPVECVARDGGVFRLRFPDLSVRPRPWRKLIAHLAKLGLVTDAFLRDQTAWCDAEGTALVIELTVPVRVIPSSTQGHHHVYIDVEMNWGVYHVLCKKMQRARLLEPGFVKVSVRNGMTFLLKPGLTKRQLIEEGRMIENKGGSCAGTGVDSEESSGLNWY